jgi:hypothetical protein
MTQIAAQPIRIAAVFVAFGFVLAILVGAV